MLTSRVSHAGSTHIETSHAAPSSITDPGWVRLSGVRVDKKRSLRLPLADSKRAFRFVALWISAAPPSARHVSVNELELFPAG